MATKYVAAALALVTVASAQAQKPYDYPAHKNVALSNYDNTGFNVGAQPLRFESKSQMTLGKTIMAHDRYHRIFKKVGDEYQYVTMIARLDRLKVVDFNGGDENDYVKVEIESSIDRRLNGNTYYTKINGLSEYEDYKNFDADVYMVQNIATEKLRVYQRICKDNSCPPKMIFETDFVAGMKKGDPDFKKNTHVGNYRIYEWEKFYQDAQKHYPSWYDGRSESNPQIYPLPPGQDKGWGAWFDKDIMPCLPDGTGDCERTGDMRGAFGWYTALVEPHYATGQWTHGTIGWSDSSIEMIKRAKGEDTLGRIANVFTSLRSSGCSRVSNPAVAFLRHILPVGTPLIKIYALEGYQDQESMERNYLVGSKSTWDFILTKDGTRKSGTEATNAHRNYVMRSGLNTPDNILEEGTYEFNNYPTVVQYQFRPTSRGYSSWRKGCVEDTVDNYARPGRLESTRNELIEIEKEESIRSRQCNVYKMDADKFVGRFYVDTGLIDGYQHPNAADQGVIRGGFRSQKWPAFLEVQNYQ